MSTPKGLFKKSNLSWTRFFFGNFLYDSVPVSKLPELVYETKKDAANSGLVAPIVGHVGDGNFHALILFKTDEEKVKAKELVHRMVKRAIALDGTCKSFFCVCIGDHSAK